MQRSGKWVTSALMVRKLQMFVRMSGDRQRRLEQLVVRLRSLGVVRFTILLFVLPALADLLSSPTRASYRWIAADTFYYLTVARNFARHGILSYDGERASNGFQPLWQLWAGVSEFFRERLGLGPIGPFLLLLSGLSMVALALGLLGATLRRARRISVLFLIAPVGLYGLTVLPAWMIGFKPLIAHGNVDWFMPVFGTPWSYVNGMESAPVLLFYALCLFLGSKPESTRSVLHAACFGCALAGLTLSRLDHAFFSLALGLGYTLICQRTGGPFQPKAGFRARAAEFVRRLQLPIVAGLSAAFWIVPYLLQNRYFFGNFVPLSGAAKSTFPNFTDATLFNLKALLSGDIPVTIDWWMQIASRVLQIVVPAIYCAAYLLIRVFRRSRAPLTTLLTASAVGGLCLCAYNYSFTPTMDQGFWYMPVATLLPTLFLLNARPLQIRDTNRAKVAIGAALACSVTAFFYSWHRHPTYNRDYRSTMLQSAGEARAFYENRLPKMIEIDDGVVGYALDTPTASWHLALDPEGFQARKEGHLIELLLSRGFDRVATSTYFVAKRSEITDSQLTKWMGGSIGQDSSKFAVHREFVSSDGKLIIGKINVR